MAFELSDFTNKRDFIEKINGTGETSGYVLTTNGTTSYWAQGGGSNTDEKVKQTKSTANVFGRLLITSKNTSSASGTITNNFIDYSYYSDSIMANPYTGEVVVVDLRATGNDVYVGSTSGSQCHQQYDNTNKCLKFIFD